MVERKTQDHGHSCRVSRGRTADSTIGNMARRMPLILLGLALLYFVSFLIIFNVTEAAYSWDEDNYGNRQVAIGPRPREIFDRPTHWDTAFETGQWTFRIYRPLCEIWLKVFGFALPCEWR
jgi:hypothetical protein